MNDGDRIRLWIRENGHTVSEVAEKLGYSRQALSSALNQNRISLQLAEALYEHFWLRVMVTTEQEDTSEAPPPHGRRGRPAGRLTSPRRSKLDAVADEIEALLNSGATQRSIAERYATTESNLHNWIKRQGLRPNRADQ